MHLGKRAVQRDDQFDGRNYPMGGWPVGLRNGSYLLSPCSELRSSLLHDQRRVVRQKQRRRVVLLGAECRDYGQCSVALRERWSAHARAIGRRPKLVIGRGRWQPASREPSPAELSIPPRR